jgi:hypothetical protein
MTFIKFYYKSITWAIIIAYLLFTPGNELPKIKFLNFYGADKLIHIILFMVFQFLTLFDSLTLLHIIKLRKILLLIIITLSYAISSEIIQQFFIENRQGSVFDFIADMVGIILAYTLFLIYKNFKGRLYRPIS